MIYLFPFAYVPQGSKIILYGAETVGYDFYRQIKTSKYCTIVKWVDRQYLWCRQMNLPVDPPEAIRESEFDFIVIAVKNEKTYSSIRGFLKGMGIPESLLIWRDDYELMSDFALRYNEDRAKAESKYAELLNPASCLTENRMEVVIRVLYAEAFYAGRLSETEVSMYDRAMLAANNFSEPTDNIIVRYFSAYSGKEGADAFHRSFHNLLESIRDDGFSRQHFLPLDRHGRLCNGAHRCAAAIALGIDAWGYEYSFDGLEYPYTTEWLLQNGFSAVEVASIDEKYRCIKDMRKNDYR